MYEVAWHATYVVQAAHQRWMQWLPEQAGGEVGVSWGVSPYYLIRLTHLRHGEVQCRPVQYDSVEYGVQSPSCRVAALSAIQPPAGRHPVQIAPTASSPSIGSGDAASHAIPIPCPGANECPVKPTARPRTWKATPIPTASKQPAVLARPVVQCAGLGCIIRQ